MSNSVKTVLASQLQVGDYFLVDGEFLLIEETNVNLELEAVYIYHLGRVWGRNIDEAIDIIPKEAATAHLNNVVLEKEMKPSTSPQVEETTGRKYDTGKAQPSLLPSGPILEISKVLAFGAKKYAPENWKKVESGKRRYTDAMLRHILAWMGGEKMDEESGLHHLAHAGCCLLFVLWFDQQEEN